MKQPSLSLLALADRFGAMQCRSITPACVDCRHHLPATERSDEACVLALIEAREGLGLGPMTLEEVADRVGLERSYVGVIEKQALAKLKKRMTGRKAA